MTELLSVWTYWLFTHSLLLILFLFSLGVFASVIIGILMFPYFIFICFDGIKSSQERERSYQERSRRYNKGYR